MEPSTLDIAAALVAVGADSGCGVVCGRCLTQNHQPGARATGSALGSSGAGGGVAVSAPGATGLSFSVTGAKNACRRSNPAPHTRQQSAMLNTGQSNP